MQNYKQLYLVFFDFGMDDFVPCEICGNEAVDIHHIDCRGMGGTKRKYGIMDLMAVCRSCHDKYGDKTQHKDMLIEKHNSYVNDFLLKKGAWDLN